MSVSLQVIYPVGAGTRFDHEYYTGTHLPMVGSTWGEHLVSTLVTKGLAGGPETPPAFHAVATLLFRDQAALDAAMAKAGPLLDDIPNFTDSKPHMLIGEVVG